MISRLGTKPLAEFLRRLGLSLEAGIDVRKALASEARRSPPALRSHVEQIAAAVQRGDSLAAGLNQCGESFPQHTRELVLVGEQTGHLPEVLKQLAAHYEEQLHLRRTFIAGITWPMMQLGIALGVIGLVILVLGLIETRGGKPVDIVGFGLIGPRGLAIYLAVIGTMGLGFIGLWLVVRSGKWWGPALQRAVLRWPQIGTALRTLAIARFSWTLHLALDAAMDVKRALALALGSTHNARFLDLRPSVLQAIDQGRDIHDALADTGEFPTEYLHTVQVGEESGLLVEQLAIVARQYHDEARRALAFLTRLAGHAVWCVVAGIIIFFIFRFASFYLGTINDALKGV